jgi:hypothetical protein
MKQTHFGGCGGTNKEHSQGCGGEIMQQTLRRGDGVGCENKRQTHCGGERDYFHLPPRHQCNNFVP